MAKANDPDFIRVPARNAGSRSRLIRKSRKSASAAFAIATGRKRHENNHIAAGSWRSRGVIRGHGRCGTLHDRDRQCHQAARLHGCRRRTDRRRSERDHGSASAERDHGCGRHEHGGIVCSGAIGATAASAHGDNERGGGGQATQGGAASPQDGQSQSRGGSTAAQQAQGARRPASENLASIQAALSEARGLDQAGKESECMDAIQRAKRLAG